MKFVVAPDKFKGSLSGHEFCTTVAKELHEAFPEAEILQIPLADGGDGTIEVVQQHLNAKAVTITVNDPLFRKVSATCLFSESKKMAFIEMSEASGHRLLEPNELNCMQTTTLGTGELIADAIQRGAVEIFLGIGGSATNDGGMGAAQALGYSFLDADGKVLRPIGKHLGDVAKIVPPKENILDSINFKVACDVDNPFYGEHGAAKVYAAQKGASKEEIELLDGGLMHFAEIINSQLEIDIQQIPGAGAAGGLGGGAVAFLNAELVSGIDLIKEIADFDAKIKGADWVITGEGKLDSQTLSGKTIGGILASAKKENIPVAALCGLVELSQSEAKEIGLAYVVSVSEGMPNLQEAMKRAEENLTKATQDFCRFLKTKS
ncbi:glycerate kinase [Allomuricauda sp. d1]|uniref:glycerate kinase n=1 Tax=Allomuricauda sp. d1 TaxID=3136725 RepID=UPI0031D995EE